MSDTPRTDTEEAMYSLSSVNSWGMGGWDFARTLERELAAKSAEVERLREALDFYACIDHYHRHKSAAPSVIQHDGGQLARSALEAK